MPLLKGLTADLEAAYQFLQQQDNVIGDKIGSIGFCLGGRVSFLANSVLPMVAAISYYGGGIDQLIDEAPNLHGAHLFYWGGLDLHITSDKIEVVNALKNAGKDYTNVVISHADHGFNWHACVNCRKMEATVWPNKSVFPVFRDSYVLIQLYTDDKTELEKAAQYSSSFSHKDITSMGSLNSDIEASRFNSNSQPFYVLLNPHTEGILVPPLGADYDPGSYLFYLKSGLNEY